MDALEAGGEEAAEAAEAEAGDLADARTGELTGVTAAFAGALAGAGAGCGAGGRFLVVSGAEGSFVAAGAERSAFVGATLAADSVETGAEATVEAAVTAVAAEDVDAEDPGTFCSSTVDGRFPKMLTRLFWPRACARACAAALAATCAASASATLVASACMCSGSWNKRIADKC